MAWFKVDDKFHSHEKLIGVSLEALGLWVVCGSWSADHQRDGFVPTKYVLTLDRDGAASELVDAGLWRDVDGGYLFHDWQDFQPTKQDSEERRERTSQARAEAGRKGGQRSGEVRRAKQNEAKTKQNEANVEAKKVDEAKRSPVPSRPVPTRPLDDDSPVIEVTTDRAREILTDKEKTLLAQIGINPSVWVTVLDKHGIQLRTPADYVRLAQHLLAKTLTEKHNPTGYLIGCVTSNPLEIRTWALDTDSLKDIA